MGRRRLAKNRMFPANLYQNSAGYFYFRDPVTKKQIGLGKDRTHAFFEARAGNDKLATRKKSSVVEWMEGKVEYTLAEWLPLYKELWMEKVGPTPATVKASDSYLRRLAESDMAERRLLSITTLMVAQYLETYKVERGAPSARQMRSKLQDVLRWAETQGLIEVGRNPVTATRAHKVTVARERMSLEQFLAVREQAPPILRNAMNLALLTGQRREDVVCMKFSDWRDDRLHVAQGKSGGRTRLAIAGSVRLSKLGLSVADVVKMCRDSVASQYLVHYSRPTGKAKPGGRMEGNTIGKMFSDARSAAGIDAQTDRTPFTFHEIRSLSERLYREEFGPEFAQSILGHKDAKMTARYDDLRGEWKIVEAA